MSEHVENITILHIRSFREELAKLSKYTYDLTQEIMVIRQRLASLESRQAREDEEIAIVKVELEKIERRLGLLD